MVRQKKVELRRRRRNIKMFTYVTHFGDDQDDNGKTVFVSAVKAYTGAGEV
jgi:hypothetical protein